MSELFDDLRWRGLVHQVTDDELGKVLDNDSLSFYHGVDPTADSLAIHHLVGLLALRRLAEAGHRPIALVGGGLIRRLEGGSAYGLTWPLVTKADGSKFGKTESGNLWLDPARTSPYALYQALVRVDDEVVGKYLRIYTFLPRDRIEDLDAATAERPEQREAQRELAHQVVALVHGEDAAAGAERAAAALFTEAIADLDEASLLDVMAEAPSASVATGSSIVDALCATGLTPSKSAAQRALQQGGVYVNNAKQATDRPLARDDALHGRYVVLRRGKG